MNVLSISVKKRLGERTTIDASFEVPSGITAIYGPSGAGKTSLLDCIAGLSTPDSGRIALNSTVWFDASNKKNMSTRTRQIGYVFQSPALFPHLTAQENSEFGLHELPPLERKARVDHALEQFRISHLAGEKPGRIAGGERQRVAIVRAMVTNPAVLMLDEPFTALDHASKSHSMEALRVWASHHAVPVLLVTHAIEEVFSLADMSVCLDSGRVVAQGPTRDILASAKEKLVEQIR